MPNGSLLSSSRLSGSRSFLAGTVSLVIIFAAIGSVYLRRYAIPAPAATGIYLAFILLLILTLAPAWPGNRRVIQSLGRTHPLLVFLPMWCFPYFLYAAGTGDFRWTALLKLLLIASIPAAIYSRFPPRTAKAFSWQDTCVAVVWVGFVLSGQLKGIWNVPINLDFMSRLFLVMVASWCWTFIRPVPDLGYSFRISGEVVKQAAINFRSLCRDRDSLESGDALHAMESTLAGDRAVPCEFSRDLLLYRATRRTLLSRLPSKPPLENATIPGRGSGAGVSPVRAISYTPRSLSELALCGAGVGGRMVLRIRFPQQRQPDGLIATARRGRYRLAHMVVGAVRLTRVTREELWAAALSSPPLCRCGRDSGEGLLAPTSLRHCLASVVIVPNFPDGG